jgi:hypothetical protein
MMDGVITKIDSQTLRWEDRHGIVHAVEGADVHRDVRLLWPRCGKGDVPASKAWKGGDAVTCPGCLAVVGKERPIRAFPC